MTEHELERWTTLVVADAQGRPLSEAARDERRRIEREQPELRSQAGLWAQFATLEQPDAAGSEGMSDAAMLAAVLARASETREPIASPSPRRRPLVRPVVGLLALAACVALGLALGRLRDGVHEARSHSVAPALGGAVMTHDTPPAMQIATPGRHALGEGECRRAGATTVCTSEQARFRVPEPGPDAVALEFEAGRLRIDASAELEGIAIQTQAGRVWAQGVIELVYDPRTGELLVEVVRGEAELIGTHGAPVRLGMGATLGLVAAAPEPEPEPTTLRPSAPPRAEPKPKPSADELLAAAQDALAAGETATAIARYDALIAEYPRTHAARAASVSLGRLLLRADRADEALAAFDHYLASDARELVEEARYGRIRALRELGRTRELDEAIASFLLAHPSSIHRERLEAWRSP